MFADSRNDIAGFYALALHLGLVPVGVVVRWADEHILAVDVPDEITINLSLAGNRPPDHVMSMLREITRSMQYSDQSLRLLASLLARDLSTGKRSAAETANLLYAVYLAAPNSDVVLGRQIRCIDEYFEPWMMGAEQAEQAVRQFLRPFAELQLPLVAIERG